MKSSKQVRSEARMLARGTFKFSPVAAGCAVLLLSGSGLAQAQDAAPAAQASGQTVVVTGIRKGIEDAISVKKNSDSIVEAISAEDIGKLPDSSIAESIARLPGLTAQRVAGRAQNISIRGMSGDFSTALLNGREQVSTSDNRSVEYDQYPSELLGSVVVYKTPDGLLVGQGLSGTVDLRTVRPLDFGSRTMAVNFRKEKSGLGTEFTGTGTRFNFSYVDQFADRTVGVAFGVARLKSDVATARSETYKTAETVKFDADSGKLYPGWKDDAPGVKVLYNGGFKYFNDSTTQTRDGAMGVLEFKPNKDLHSTLDLYYSKFDKNVVKRGLEIQPEDTWKSDTSPQYPGIQNPVITDGRLISGTWLNVNPLSRHIWEPRKDELQSIGWNTKYNFAPKWAGIVDLSYSSAKRHEQISEMEAGIPTPGSVTISDYNKIDSFQFDYGDVKAVKLMDPESWGQNGYDKQIDTKDTIQAVRLGLQRDLEGAFSRIEFGVNLSEREKNKTATESKLILKGGAGSVVDLPSDATSVKVGGTNFNAVSFDPAKVYNTAYNFVPNYFADIFLKSWEVKEKVNTLFSKADIDTELLGLPLRGNVGLQVINTDQKSTAPSVDLSNQGVATLFTDGKTYTDVLPSMNLAFNLGSDQTVRVGLGQQMARARMDQLSAGRRAEVKQTGLWEGEGGNPKLDPFRATALDLSYEKYFGTKAYVSAAAFYKDLKSYIFDFTDTNYDFSNFTNISSNTPTSNFGKFKQPRNGKGGSLSGVELSASLPLNLLTPMLNGFGVVASYADTNSEVKPFGDADKRPLPGLSRQVASLTGYYENYGFSFRAAARHRSNFLGEVQGFGAGREYTYIKAETILDLQMGYELQSGPAKGLSFLVQVNNANNAKYQRYQDTPDNIIDTIKYGKTVLMGATYKF
jgi:iron complex outermembrane receptor protein